MLILCTTLLHFDCFASERYYLRGFRDGYCMHVFKLLNSSFVLNLVGTHFAYWCPGISLLHFCRRVSELSIRNIRRTSLSIVSWSTLLQSC